MIEFVQVRQLKMTRRELQQLRVHLPSHTRQALLNCTRHVGWFYGDKALGKDYGREPHILCTDAHDTPFLIRVGQHYSFEGSILKVAGFEIPQVFVK